MKRVLGISREKIPFFNLLTLISVVLVTNNEANRKTSPRKEIKSLKKYLTRY